MSEARQISAERARQAQQRRLAESIRETELRRQAEASKQASLRKIAEQRRTKVSKSQDTKEGLATGASTITAIESAKTTTKLTFAVNKRLRSNKKSQESNITNIVNQFQENNKKHNEIVSNKSKFTKSSYAKYNAQYKKYQKEVELALKQGNTNISKIDSALASNVNLRDSSIKLISNINSPKTRPVAKKNERLEQKTQIAITGPPTAKQIKLTKATTQRINVAKLKKAGVLQVTGETLTLTVPPSSLTKDLAKAANRAGFDVSIEGGLSTSFYDWARKNSKSDVSLRAGEYGAVVLGQGEKVYANTVGRIGAWVSGNPQSDYRKFDIETLKQSKNLDNVDIGYLRVGTAGANFLANYAAFLPIGIATSQVLKSVASIPGVSKVGSKVAQTKILQEISKHPKIIQAMVYGPVVGVSAKRIYNDFKSGKPQDEILQDIAMTAGTISGQAYGLVDGYKLSSKVEGWFATRGRTKIPPKELWDPEALKSQKYSTYKSSKRNVWSKEFKDTAKKLTAEGYLGKVAPGEFRVWHGTQKTIQDGEYFAEGVWTVGTGDSSKHAGVGLFVAPSPSSYGIRLHKGLTGEGARLGLPGIKGTSEIATIDAFVDVMPNGLTQAQLKQWFIKRAGDSTVYIPPISTITREMEALLPPGTQLGVIGNEWYTNFGGQRVLVNKYILIPSGAVVPDGVKLVSLSQISSSTLPTSEAYLAVGLIPSSYQNLSTSQISLIAKQTGLSESDIRNLSTSIQSVSETVTRADVKNVEVTSGELSSILQPSMTLTSSDPTSSSLPGPVSVDPTKPPPPPTPILTLSKKDRRLRNSLNLRLFRGAKSRFLVTYIYSTSRQEVVNVEARSFPEAINKAQRRRKSSKKEPKLVDVVKFR